MTKHTIDIEGLPKGWEPEKVTINPQNICGTNYAVVTAMVELRKTKPREITLVETEQDNIKHDGKWCNQHFRDGLILTQQPKYWRIKGE